MKTEKDLEDLKQKINELFPDFKQPFTLTSDEVIIVNHFLTCDKRRLEQEEKSFENDLMIKDLDHILNKIKLWQDEK